MKLVCNIDIRVLCVYSIEKFYWCYILYSLVCLERVLEGWKWFLGVSFLFVGCFYRNWIFRFFV